MSKVNSLVDELAQVGIETGAIREPAVAADAALAGALDYMAQKMTLLGPQSALDHLRVGDAAALGYFQYALAQRIAAYLASCDVEVRAAYMYDDEATVDDVTFGNVQPASLLHLIVWTRRKTEALYSLVDALDRALAAGYAQRVGLPKIAHLLDAQFVDDNEVQQCKGYGRLLSSVHYQPVLVWEK